MQATNVEFLQKLLSSIQSSSFRLKGIDALEDICNFLNCNFVQSGQHVEDVFHLVLLMSTTCEEFALSVTLRQLLVQLWDHSSTCKDVIYQLTMLLIKVYQNNDDSEETEVMQICFPATDILSLIFLDLRNENVLGNLSLFCSLVWSELLSLSKVDLNVMMLLRTFTKTMMNSQSGGSMSLQYLYELQSNLLSYLPRGQLPSIEVLLEPILSRLNYWSNGSTKNKSVDELNTLLDLLCRICEGAIDKSLIFEDNLRAKLLIKELGYVMETNYGSFAETVETLWQYNYALWNCVLILQDIELLSMETKAVFNLFSLTINTVPGKHIIRMVSGLFRKSWCQKSFDSFVNLTEENLTASSDPIIKYSMSRSSGIRTNLSDSVAFLLPQISLDLNANLCKGRRNADLIQIVFLLFTMTLNSSQCELGSSLGCSSFSLEDLELHVIRALRYSSLEAKALNILIGYLDGLMNSEQGRKRLYKYTSENNCELYFVILTSLSGKEEVIDSLEFSLVSLKALFRFINIHIAYIGSEETRSKKLNDFRESVESNSLIHQFLNHLLSHLINDLDSVLFTKHSPDEEYCETMLSSALILTFSFLHSEYGKTTAVEDIWFLLANLIDRVIQKPGMGEKVLCYISRQVSRFLTDAEDRLNDKDLNIIVALSSTQSFRALLSFVKFERIVNQLNIPGKDDTISVMTALDRFLIVKSMERALSTNQHCLRSILTKISAEAMTYHLHDMYHSTDLASRKSAIQEESPILLKEDDMVQLIYNSMLGDKTTRKSSSLFISFFVTIVKHFLQKKELRSFGIGISSQVFSLDNNCFRYLQDPLFFPLVQEELESLADFGWLDALSNVQHQVFEQLLVPLLISYASDDYLNSKASRAEALLNLLINTLFRSRGEFSGSHSAWFRNVWRSSELLVVLFKSDSERSLLGTKSGPKLRSYLHHRMDVSAPGSGFLKDLSPIVVYIILDHLRDSRSPSEIIQGLLAEDLNLAINLFHDQEKSNLVGTLEEIFPISLALFHQILLPFVWMLGSKEEEEATLGQKSILILCYLYTHNSWALEKRKVHDRHMVQCAQKELPNHFLHFMSSLLQQQWSYQSESQQSRNLRALQRLLSFFPSGDLAKYFPKIFALVESALMDDSRSESQFEAVNLIVYLTKTLPPILLANSLHEMLIVLFPILENREENVQWPTSLVDTGKKVHYTRFFVRAKDHDHNSAILDVALSSNVLANSVEDPKGLVARTKSLVLKLFNDLFYKRADVISCLPYVPNVPELKAFTDYFEQNMVEKTFSERIESLLKLLKGNRVPVISAALAAFRVLLRNNKAELYKACFAQNQLLGTDKRIEVVKSISKLIKELVVVSSRQQNPRVLILCSACLGDIGALHPTLISQHDEPSSPRSKASLFTLSPTNLSALHVGMHLLKEFIVPSLKAAQGSWEQDKSAFAAQEILRYLVNSINNGKRILSEALEEEGILDFVEPFFYSKYVQKSNDKSMDKMNNVPSSEKSSGSLSFYSRSRSFHHWLTDWVKHLITLVCGELQPLFVACKGMLSTSAELCQFLIPYLILDINEDGTDFSSVFLREIATVLQCRNPGSSARKESNQPKINGVTDLDRKSIQYIFSLLDLFSIWISEGRKHLAVLAKNSSSGNEKMSSASTSLDSTAARDGINSSLKGGHSASKGLKETNVHISSKERIANMCNILHKIFCGLPSQDLIKSALCLKAYARAVRYVESTVKESQARLRNSQGAELSRSEYELISIAFAKLGDADSLEGIRHLTRPASSLNAEHHENIIFYELQNDWRNALLEYDFLLKNKLVYLADPKPDMILHIDPLDLQQTGGIDIEVPLAAEASFLETSMDTLSIQKGKLRCLIELEHLEAAVNSSIASLGENFTRSSTFIPTASLAVEAAWKLSSWNKLDTFLEAEEKNLAKLPCSSSSFIQNPCLNSRNALPLPTDSDDLYQIYFGHIFSLFYHHQYESIPLFLDQARLLTMNSFSAASMESYERAYPYLLRLHCLSDTEDFLQVLASNARNSFQKVDLMNKIDNELQWTSRVDCMSEDLSARSHVLSMHRSLFNLLINTSDAKNNTKTAAIQLHGQNRVYLSNYLRKMGSYEGALTNLRFAQQYGINMDEILLGKGWLLLERGCLQQALAEVEPLEINIAEMLEIVRGVGDESTIYIGSQQIKRQVLAEKIFLATLCLEKSKQRQGIAIVERYKATIAINPWWDKPYLQLAKYYEYLFLQYSAISDKASSSHQVNERAQLHRFFKTASPDLSLDFSLVERAIDQYGQCLRISTDQVITAEVLRRMLTLWFTFTAFSVRNTPSSILRRSASDESSHTKYRAKVNGLVKDLVQKVDAKIWYSSIAQLISRVLHPCSGTVAVILSVVTRALLCYPKHTIWHTANLMYSFNSDRKIVAKQLLRDVYKQFTNANSPTVNKQHSQMLADSQNLFQSLIQLAGFQTKERRIEWSIDKKFNLGNFIIPTKQVLLNCRNDGEEMIISEFVEWVDVTSSKAKPKIITFLAKCGKRAKFLCKQEKDGDLRKDAHMMEVNTLVNRLLVGQVGGQQKGLRVTTYGVTCLNEECGLLEWVNNTECLRYVINTAYAYDPQYYPNINYRDIHQRFVEHQTKYESDLPQLVQSYIKLIDSFNYKPCFHKWFLHRHSDPTAWLQARQRYTRSMAVWSAIGYIIGLGDRHTENILLDVMSCDVVHVDFDCLFDKGLLLMKPEIVPFRLTSNLVDAMGISGVEGVFRKALEFTLMVLREHAETFLTVIEPFLRDPTVSWSRSGRAQKTHDGTVAEQMDNGKTHDTENKEADEMLNKIGNRLRGVYNIIHPHREKLLRSLPPYKSPSTFGTDAVDSTMHMEDSMRSAKGLGAGREEQLLPLSVEGQAQRLIDEARAVENLAQLYVGELDIEK